MTAVTNDLIYSVLKTIQADISVLKEAVRRIDARMASMDHHMAGFYSEQRWQNDELDNIKRPDRSHGRKGQNPRIKSV